MEINVRLLTIDHLVAGVINGVINALIAYSGLSKEGLIPLSVDQISTTQQTILGQSVAMAFTLGLVVTIVSSKVFAKHVIKKHPEMSALVIRPIFPDVLRIALNNSVFLFGWFVIIALAWQRFIGTVMVNRLSGAFLIGLVALIITMIVNFRTEKALLQRE